MKSNLNTNFLLNFGNFATFFGNFATGRSLNFPPAQSSFGLSFGKAISDAGGMATYFATYLRQISTVTEL